ncbi:hypothetical protein K0M31_015856 [Melipona bicolor]|uniref:Uncharacterized protein n=1 Tax=Melipona bicolor TaxID=60889 RepID=A0AA40G5Y5_9HYME|nr:hypothetical protein K0M31_015856 [Melipona bicolor]
MYLRQGQSRGNRGKTQEGEYDKGERKAKRSASGRSKNREERKMKEQIDGAADEKAAVRPLSREGKIEECC